MVFFSKSYSLRLFISFSKCSLFMLRVHRDDFIENFWSFKSCINDFEHCIPVIQIDGTHLYRYYPNVLLSATTLDGFNHIMPLSFTIVEAKNLSSYVMHRLRRLVVLNRHGICVTSDRYTKILTVM